MDPLSAISLAGTIIQFIEATAKVVSVFKELQNGAEATKDIQRLEFLNDGLVSMAEGLIKTEPPEVGSSQRLEEAHKVSDLFI